MPAIDCGIDIGSTNIKAVFVGEDGGVLHTRSIPAPRVDDGLGPVTDPLQLVAELERLVIEGWREIGAHRPLRSITTAGVGEDGLGVTRALLPTGHAMPWFDKRAAAEARSLQAFAHLASRTGIGIDESRTAAKWLWLHCHRPQELEDTGSWLALTDFPIASWAGKSFMSSSLAPRTACFDVHTRAWVPELLAAAHAPDLPEVVSAGTIIGGVRKGPLRDSGAASSETLLVAGGHDHPIAATIIRRFDANARVDSLGTANLVYGETALFNDPAMTRKLAFSIPPAGPGFTCLGVIELSAALTAFFDAGKLRTYLSGNRISGMPPRTMGELKHPAGTDETIARRMLESLSLEARQLLVAMDQAGVPSGRVFTTGGWSRSRAFVELRASVFGHPIASLGDLELTAAGAALFGAEAATGKFMCPLHANHVTVIDPLPAWSSEYEALFGS